MENNKENILLFACLNDSFKKKLIELYKSIPEGSTKSWHYKECKKWFDGEYGDRKMTQDEALFFIRALEPLSDTNNKEI
jgi:hypothetical protein